MSDPSKQTETAQLASRRYRCCNPATNGITTWQTHSPCLLRVYFQPFAFAGLTLPTLCLLFRALVHVAVSKGARERNAGVYRDYLDR